MVRFIAEYNLQVLTFACTISKYQLLDDLEPNPLERQF